MKFLAKLSSFILTVMALGIPLACDDTENGQPSTDNDHTGVEFIDDAKASGLDFLTSHGGSGRRLFIEISAGGVALFDADNDQDLDIYLVNGAPTEGFEGSTPLQNALFLNNGSGGFERAKETGLEDEGYGCGVAVGDIDQDGDLDVFVSNYGNDALYRNRGDGTYENITAASEWGAPAWSSSAAFFDYDHDQDLDLYVCRYVDYDIENPPLCVAPDGQQEYCNPGDFAGAKDAFYRNDGGGVFVEVTDEAGLGSFLGRAFGVTACDYDDDGDIDLYVANDQNRNNLYQNQGDGSFVDIGLFSGVGYGVTGVAEAGMGCDFGDIDGDLKPDIVVTNFASETNSLYRNLGDDLFSDETLKRGIGAPTAQPLAFGTGFFDMDNDSDLDLFFACGHVLDTIERYGKGETFAQKDILLRNDQGRFENISSRAGSAFQSARVGRAAAFGDLDHDGDIDLVVTHMNDNVALYRNQSESKGQSVLLDLRDKNHSPAIGAKIVATIGERQHRRDVRGAASFQSHNDLRVHLGLGKAQKVSQIDVVWPDGSQETYSAIEGGAVVIIQQGTGVLERLPFRS